MEGEVFKKSVFLNARHFGHLFSGLVGQVFCENRPDGPPLAVSKRSLLMLLSRKLIGSNSGPLNLPCQCILIVMAS